MDNRLLPSILSADFAYLSRDIKTLDRLSIRSLHIDVMDGHFVPNITLGPCVIEKIRRVTSMFFDVHLMLKYPQNYVNMFAEAGADSITVHVEADHDVCKTISMIRLCDKKTGIAVNPDTPFEKIKNILNEVDIVLVMGVFPGFGGQSFLGSVLEKIEKIRNFVDKKNLKIDLQVDGGINDQTIVDIKKSGANGFVVGNYLFGQRQIVRTIKKLRKIIHF